jgi:glutathione S-transferase
MKLYHQARTRSARVLWMLEELQEDAGVQGYELEQVNVFVGEGRHPEYLKVHPHGFVPALEDDGQVLLESSAICMYLADRYCNGALAPNVGTKERGKYYEWMVYVPATADPACETIMFHTMFLPEQHRVPALVDRAQKRWSTKIEPHYAAALASSPYVLGETFTAADVMVASSLGWARVAGALGDSPVLARYLERISARPAFAKAFFA